MTNIEYKQVQDFTIREVVEYCKSRYGNCHIDIGPDENFKYTITKTCPLSRVCSVFEKYPDVIDRQLLNEKIEIRKMNDYIVKDDRVVRLDLHKNIRDKEVTLSDTDESAGT